MTRKRAAWPVLAVADRSAERRISRSSTGIALSASSDEELVERVRLGDEADDRDEHEQERHRRQERVVGELARDAGDVVGGSSAASCPRTTSDEPRAERGGSARRRERTRRNPCWGRCSSPRWISAEPRRPQGDRPRPVPEGGARPPPPSGVPRPGSDHPPGGRNAAMTAGSCCHRGSSYCPRAAVRRTRGARAQRLGSPGHRSHGNVVERRDGPHLFLAPSRRVSWPRVRIGFVGAGLMGSGMVRNLAAAGHDVRAATPGRPRGPGTCPRRWPPSVAEAVDGADLGVLLRDRLGRRPRGGRGRARGARPAARARGDEHHRPRRRARAGGRLRRARRRLPRLPGQRRPGGRGGRDAGVHVRRRRRRARPRGAGARRHGRPRRSASTAAPSASGLVAKLVNNMLVASIAAAHGRGPRRRPAGGPRPGARPRGGDGSSGDSWQLRNLFPRVLDGDHRPGFTVRNLLKDLGHAAGLEERDRGARRGRPRPAASGCPPDVDYGARRAPPDGAARRRDRGARLLGLREQDGQVGVGQAVGDGRQAEVVLDGGGERRGPLEHRLVDRLPGRRLGDPLGLVAELVEVGRRAS